MLIPFTSSYTMWYISVEVITVAKVNLEEDLRIYSKTKLEEDLGEDSYVDTLEDFQEYNNFSELKSKHINKEDKVKVKEDFKGVIFPKGHIRAGYLTPKGRQDFIEMVIGFCEFLSNRPLYSYQKDVARNIIREFLLNDAEEITLLFSRQSGKTEVLSVVIAGLIVFIEKAAPVIKDLALYKEGLRIGYFAGTTYQVETLFDRTSNILENKVACEVLAELDEKKKTRGKLLRVGKSYIYAKTAAKQSKVESKTYDLIIVDECVSKGTLVSTAQYEDFYDKRNYKKIEDLKVGDKIYSFNISLNRSEITEVEKVWCNGIRKVYNLEDSNGNILTLTDNHRIYTSIGWKTIKDLLSINYSEILIYSFPPYYRDRIKSITPSGETEVWDLTTKSDNHNFYANGILVHNCQDVDAQMLRKSISPMLSSTAGLFIKSGTPNTKVCELYEACLRTKKRNYDFEDLCPNTQEKYEKKYNELSSEAKRLLKQVKILQYPKNKTEINILKKKKEYLAKIQQDLKTLDQNWEFKETPRKFYFEVPWTVAAKENPRYRRYVEKEKCRLGEHSDDFLMSYSLVWMVERGMFITEKGLAMCELPSPELVHSNQPAWKILSQGDILESWDLSPTVAGIDWGKTNDSTIMSVFYVDWDNPIFLSEENSEICFFNKVLIHWLELIGDDYESQYPQIEDVMHRFNVKRIAMDANGVGDPIFDRFVHKFEGTVDIWGVKTNSATTVSDMIKHWASEIKMGRYWFPASEDAKESREYKMFCLQMKGWYKEWKNGYLVCHHDQKDKEAHDDYPFSSLLGVWAARTRLNMNLDFSPGIYTRKSTLLHQGNIRSNPRRVRSWRR